MNIVLWVLQVLLALFCAAGGSFKAFNTDKLPPIPSTQALPTGVWIALGVLEMACALGLVLPGKLVPNAIFAAACILAVENLLLVVLNVAYAPAPMEPAKLFAPQYPLIWVSMITVLAVIIAYGRYAKPS